MDVYVQAETKRGLSLDARIGGSPFNVAIGVARLRQAVAYLGSISRDAFGARLLAALQDEGVDTRPVQRSAAPTTLSIVGLDAQGSPTYTFHGECGADRQLSKDALTQIPRSIDALHVGSYALVVDPVATTLRGLIDNCHRSSLVTWDPNVRPGVVPDEARWRELLEWMLSRSHMLKLSEEDLAFLAPDSAPGDFAALALRRGVRLVVLTQGPLGATAWSRAFEVHVPAASVDVVDTVGAGDAFQAALLVWLAEQGRLTPAGVTSLGDEACAALLTFATRAAALTCGQRGAVLPRRDELGAPVR